MLKGKMMRLMTAASIGVLGALAAAQSVTAQTTLQLNFVGQNNNNIDATFLRAYAEKVKERSNGNLTVTIHYSSSLVPHAQAFDALKNGLIDMHFDSPIHVGGMVPEADVYSLLFNFTDHRDFVRKHYACNLNKLINDSYLEQGMRFVGAVPGYGMGLMMKSSKISSADDLKGKRVRVAGKALADSVTLLGASPVYIPFTELEVALDRGTVDGFATGWANLAFLEGLRRGTKYLTWPALQGSLGIGLVMGEVKYRALSDADKKVVTEVFDELNQDYTSKLVEDAEAKARETVTKAGVEIVELPASEVASWKRKLAPVWEEYLKRTAARGQKNGERGKAIVDIINKGC
jgi:C4-dicarboxylate-binding protein DctP